MLPNSPLPSPLPRARLKVALRHAKRLIILVVGLTVILLGVAIFAFPGPGPGIFITLGGLMILATEFVWARRLLKRAKAAAEKVADSFSNVLPGKRPKAGEHNPSYFRRWIMKIRVPGDDLPQPSDPAAPGDLPTLGAPRRKSA
jgi:hypothetical protein